MFSFASQEEMLAAIEQEMRDVLEVEASPKNHMYGMMHYHMGWIDQQFQPANNKAGKRLRPLLCLLCCQGAGGDWQQAVPAAAALELLHNFSLIHDDIQDASPTRRGRLAVWNIWGIPLGLNAGDALFALAHLALNRLIDRGVDAQIVVQALRRFDETCVQLTQGQHADIQFETRDDVTQEEYLDMIEGKTAALISLSTELGALIAGRDKQTIKQYAAFGRHLGMAFQVRDDMLGIWGDERRMGKSATSDIETRKKTLPVLYGLAHSQPLRHLYSQPKNDPNFVVRSLELLNQNGARSFCEEHISHYSHRALQYLEMVQPGEPALTTINQLTGKLMARAA
ncbi:MAG: polyprenyl synthetase family protein [Ardenticatenaceae bacterium]